MSKSPYDITDSDCINKVERLLKYAETNNPRKVSEGSLNAHTARKDIEIYKRILKILRANKPRQLTLKDQLMP